MINQSLRTCIQVQFKLFSTVLYYKICNLMHTMQCDVTRCIICISSNFEYFDNILNNLNLNDLCNTVKKMLNKIWCHIGTLTLSSVF